MCARDEVGSPCMSALQLTNTLANSPASSATRTLCHSIAQLLRRAARRLVKSSARAGCQGGNDAPPAGKLPPTIACCQNDEQQHVPAAEEAADESGGCRTRPLTAKLTLLLVAAPGARAPRGRRAGAAESSISSQ